MSRTSIRHNGVEQFQADTLQVSGNVYDFLDSVVVPPPNPPNDPDAMSMIAGHYASHTCGAFVCTNGQDFGALWGMQEGSAQVINTWPYRPQTSLFFAIPPNKHYGGVIHMPTNPGTIRHGLHGDPYGGSAGYTSSHVSVDWSVVAITGTAPPTGHCSGVFAFDGSTFVMFNPSTDVTHDNPALCNLRPGGSYRLILKPRSTTTANCLLTLI
jgi:hypothetical protein